MKKLGIIVVVILLLVILVVAIDRLNSHSITTRVRAIRVGDSKQQVEYLLGRPVSVFTPSPEAQTNPMAAIFSVSSVTWAYGSRLDLQHAFYAEFPYFCPIRLRFFKPDADDVSIEFDSAGSVNRITIP